MLRPESLFHFLAPPAYQWSVANDVERPQSLYLEEHLPPQVSENQKYGTSYIRLITLTRQSQ